MKRFEFEKSMVNVNTILHWYLFTITKQQMLSLLQMYIFVRIY